MNTKGPVERIGEIEMWIEPESRRLLPMVREWPPNPNLQKMIVTAVMLNGRIEMSHQASVERPEVERREDDGYTWAGRKLRMEVAVILLMVATLLAIWLYSNS